METFSQHTGTGVPLRRSNVDTDQIIPAVYLKRVTRTGFEDGLFAAWRNDPEFVLNQAGVSPGVTSSSPGPTSAPARRASTRSGRCMDYGFKVVISSRFGDIFRGNSGKAGLLAAQVSPGGRRAAVEASSRPTRRRRSPSTSRRKTIAVRRRRRAVPDRRLHALASARGPRRHRHHARHDDDISEFEAHRPSWKPVTL